MDYELDDMIEHLIWYYPCLFYSDSLGLGWQSWAFQIRKGLAIGGKWFSLGVMENAIVLGLGLRWLHVLGEEKLLAQTDWVCGLRESEIFFQNSGCGASFQHRYLWRLAPYLSSGGVVDSFCEWLGMDGEFIYLSCFLFNSVFGVLVEDYAGIDIIGRSSKALALEVAAVGNVGVSFSLEGYYSGVVRCGLKG